MLDDEKSYTDLMSQMLEENLGCHVAGFTRPFEALSVIADLKPAVVVTDYYMPQIDGIEFVRRASALVPRTHFVLITAHNLEEVKDRMAALAALKGFLPKPFGWRRLANEILRVWPTEFPAPAPRADVAPA